MKTLKINTVSQLKLLISFLQKNHSMVETFNKVNLTLDLLEIAGEKLHTDLHFESHSRYLDLFDENEELIFSIDVFEPQIIEFSEEGDLIYNLEEKDVDTKLTEKEIEESLEAIRFLQISQLKKTGLKEEEDNEFLNYLGFTDEEVKHYGKRFNHIHDIFFKDTQLEIK